MQTKSFLKIWLLSVNFEKFTSIKLWMVECPQMDGRMSHTLQSALESGQEAMIVQIDFSAAFDRVNHQGIIYK